MTKPTTRKASAQRLDGAFSFDLTATATAVAERFQRRFGLDQLRFTNSGTEATMLCAYLARAVTGRRKVAMARYGYHGSLEEFEVGFLGHEGPETVLARHGGDTTAHAGDLLVGIRLRRRCGRTRGRAFRIGDEAEPRDIHNVGTGRGIAGQHI